jgi:SagB-type dehydrogenase family enzyme
MGRKREHPKSRQQDLPSPVIPRGGDAKIGTDLHPAVMHYHHRTKHHFDRYARSAGSLDWAAQPDPFRRFAGSPTMPLPLSSGESAAEYDALFLPGRIPVQPVSRTAVSALLEYSLGLSAWKEFRESRWALRMNPSSGNLHPTEGYLVIGGVPGLDECGGVFHYAPREHVLERRAEFPTELWLQRTADFPPGTFFIGLTSIHWREAWKYGERAYRYCQHDVGHAVAAVALSAAVQGWRCVALSDMNDAEIAAWLGLDRSPDFEPAEPEAPDLILAIVPCFDRCRSFPRRLDAIPQEVRWSGRANRLSSSQVKWPVIDEVAAACAKTGEAPSADSSVLSISEIPFQDSSASRWIHGQVPASRIIRQRRSALAMDGRTSIAVDVFYRIMDRILPRFDRAPWESLGPPSCIHAAIFVHRVEGLEPGLYVLVRSRSALAELRDRLDARFAWTKPLGCPESLPLFMLAAGDTRSVATTMSCHQDLAGNGAFSLGMIAEFDEPLRRFGAWWYRRLFWEAGLIGQVLYLEAEAAGVRGTGIGCYFDDPMHRLLGLKDSRFQSLYHFAIGGPVNDRRLTTLPPYPPEVYARQ